MEGNTNLADEKIDSLKIKYKSSTQTATSISVSAGTWTDIAEMTFTPDEYGTYLVIGTVNVYNSTSDEKQIGLRWTVGSESVICNPAKDWKGQVMTIATIGSTNNSIKLVGHSVSAATAKYGRIQALKIM